MSMISKILNELAEFNVEPTEITKTDNGWSLRFEHEHGYYRVLHEPDAYLFVEEGQVYTVDEQYLLDTGLKMPAMEYSDGV